MTKPSSNRRRPGADLASLWRAFRGLYQIESERKRRLYQAQLAARRQYPKPTTEVERILLLNKHLKNWRVDEPIADHAPVLIEICGKAKREEFDHHYNALEAWRAWQSRCRAIDESYGMDALKAISDEAFRQRQEAALLLETTPARSVADIRIKLQYFLAVDEEEDALRTMLGKMVGDLRRSPAKVLSRQ